MSLYVFADSFRFVKTKREEIVMTQCKQCRIGRYQLKTVPYVGWLENHILVIPNLLTYFCDNCHHQQTLDHVSGSAKPVYRANDVPVQQDVIQQIVMNWQQTRRMSRGVN